MPALRLGGCYPDEVWSVVASVSFPPEGVMRSLLGPPEPRVLLARTDVLGRPTSEPLEFRAAVKRDDTTIADALD